MPQLGQAIVRFKTREAALAAKRDAPWTRLCIGVDTLYNERSYDGCQVDDGRGWWGARFESWCLAHLLKPHYSDAPTSHSPLRCCFENEVSRELLMRLSVYPSMKTVLDRLPPKMLSLASGRLVVAVEEPVIDLEARIDQVVGRIERATFTGKGDKDKVPKLYMEYVERVVGRLQGTLGFQQMPLSGEVETRLRAPQPELSPVSPLHYADGQRLLLVSEKDSRCDGRVGTTQIGSVKGGRFELTLTGGSVELSFDSVSQAVLPWQTPTDGWDRVLGCDLSVLQSVLVHMKGLKSKRQSRVVIADSVKMMLADMKRASPALESLAADIRTARRSVQRLSEVVRGVGLEVLAAEALNATRAGGVRRYAVDQALTVRLEDGNWHDAEVIAVEGGAGAHQLQLQRGVCVLTLHPWNHAPRELPHDAFEELRGWWMQSLRSSHAHLADALLGRKLNVLDNYVAINTSGEDASRAGVSDAKGLARWLHKLHA